MSLITEYRPQTWGEIVGQDHIVEALKNSIGYEKLSNAYLFVGQFGTGKTTTARVFAKTLNCANLSEMLEPCGECTPCKAITKGNSLDVKELDMASNRGIDDVRAIKEFAAYAPMGGAYRVFICDEAHQLTQQAASALLKILEEPPKNVIFILCTTELHKMMDTIRSRCQVHNFKKIDSDIIVNRLISLCNKEQVFQETDDSMEVFKAISESCLGSMRQAESMLSNIISSGEFTLDKFRELFGANSVSIYDEFFNLIKNKQIAEILTRFEDMREDLTEPSKWVEGFALYLFDKMRKDEQNYKFYLGYLELIDKYLVNIYQNQPIVYVKLLLLNMAQLEVKDAQIKPTASTVTTKVVDVNDVWSLARWFDAIRITKSGEVDWKLEFLSDGSIQEVWICKNPGFLDKDSAYILVDDVSKILRFAKDIDKQILVDKELVKIV